MFGGVDIGFVLYGVKRELLKLSFDMQRGSARFFSFAKMFRVLLRVIERESLNRILT